MMHISMYIIVYLYLSQNLMPRSSSIFGTVMIITGDPSRDIYILMYICPCLLSASSVADLGFNSRFLHEGILGKVILVT